MTDPLAGLPLGRLLKERGIQTAQDARESPLAEARRIAREVGRSREDGRVTADDVLIRMDDPAALGPAAGSIFRGRMWRFTGVWIRSSRPSNHARSIRVWEYLGE